MLRKVKGEVVFNTRPRRRIGGVEVKLTNSLPRN